MMDARRTVNKVAKSAKIFLHATVLYTHTAYGIEYGTENTILNTVLNIRYFEVQYVTRTRHNEKDYY
jgi:hypothetical protein